jgi:hypothetical protein
MPRKRGIGIEASLASKSLHKDERKGSRREQMFKVHGSIDSDAKFLLLFEEKVAADSGTLPTDGRGGFEFSILNSQNISQT